MDQWTNRIRLFLFEKPYENEDELRHDREIFFEKIIFNNIRRCLKSRMTIQEKIFFSIDSNDLYERFITLSLFAHSYPVWTDTKMALFNIPITLVRIRWVNRIEDWFMRKTDCIIQSSWRKPRFSYCSKVLTWSCLDVVAFWLQETLDSWNSWAERAQFWRWCSTR